MDNAIHHLIDGLERQGSQNSIMPDHPMMVAAAHELRKYRATLATIEKLVHVPTPQGTKAYTHFMRDFDQVRALCRKALSSAEGT